MSGVKRRRIDSGSEEASAAKPMLSRRNRRQLARDAEDRLRELPFMHDASNKELCRFLSLKAACTELETPNCEQSIETEPDVAAGGGGGSDKAVAADGSPVLTPSTSSSSNGSSIASTSMKIRVVSHPMAPEPDLAALQPWVSPSPALDRQWRALLLRTREWEQVQAALRAAGAVYGADSSVHYDPSTALDDPMEVAERRHRAMQQYHQVFGEEPPAAAWGNKWKSLWPSQEDEQGAAAAGESGGWAATDGAATDRSATGEAATGEAATDEAATDEVALAGSDAVVVKSQRTLLAAGSVSAPSSAGTKSDKSRVKIRIRNKAGGTVYFRVRRETPMKTLLRAYCKETGDDVESVCLARDGKSVEEGSLGSNLIEDGSILWAMRTKTGR